MMPSYQELTPETFKIFQAELHETKNTINALKAGMEDEDEDKPKEDEKEHEGGMTAMKHRLRKAMDEEEDEDVKKGMKKALEAMDEEEMPKKDDKKEDKEGEEEEKEKEEEEEVKEARIASLENELKKPIIAKIMTLNASVDPKLNKKHEKIRLMKASLNEVKKEWQKIEKFSFVAGLDAKQQQAPQAIPYAFNASVEDTTYEGSQDTEKLLEELRRPGVQ